MEAGHRFIAMTSLVVVAELTRANEITDAITECVG
jgi:hypothetical protein